MLMRCIKNKCPMFEEEVITGIMCKLVPNKRFQDNCLGRCYIEFYMEEIGSKVSKLIKEYDILIGLEEIIQKENDKINRLRPE